MATLQPFANLLKENWKLLAVWAAFAVLFLVGRMGLFGEEPGLGEAAPPVRLLNLAGNEVDLANHLGKDVIVLDFWATWCPPCRASLPGIAALTKEFDGKGVQVFAVNQGESREAVEAFLKSENLALNVLFDVQTRVGNAYHVQGIPHQVVIAKDQRIQYVNVGHYPGAEAALRAAVEKLLSGEDLIPPGRAASM